MKLQTRRELADVLEDRMAGSYQRLREEGELEYEGNLVKAYLVECDPGRSGESVWEALRDVLRPEAGAFREGSTVEPTEEDDFYYCLLETGRGRAELHVDATDPRFLFAHTLDVSTATDAAIQRLVSVPRAFDAMWFPSQVLEQLAGLGEFRGLGLDFDSRDFDGLAALPSGNPAYLKAQIWCDRGSHVLDLFRQSYAAATALAKVSIRYQLRDREDFCIDDVKHNGKITTRGQSYGAHISLINAIRAAYRRVVEQLEQQFALRYNDLSQPVGGLGGEPLILAFDPPLRDLSRFCDVVFSGGPPFRICGTTVADAGRGAYVAGTDLHSGACLSFEICQDFMRVYMPDDACGNTLLRLYSNLQHTVESTVRAEANDGTPVIEL